MKIALVAPTQIPSRRANTIQVMKMAQALVETGHEVRLASPFVGEPASQAAWESLAEQYGLQTRFVVEWLPVRAAWRRYDYGFSSVRWAQRWRADCLYTRLPQAAAFASQAGLATVFEVHDFPYGFVAPWLWRLFLGGTGAARLVVITRALLDDLRQRFNLPLEQNPGQAGSFALVAPDGVDVERYQDLPAPPAARQALVEQSGLGQPGTFAAPDLAGFANRFTVGYTGHLYPGRGIELILAMAQALPEVNFMLVGGEPGDVARVAGQIRQARLENVACLGFVSNRLLPIYQAACDLFLMPYQAQVAASSGGNIARYLSPMKLFEHLACGRPILCTNLPVLGEVLNSRNSILLPPGPASAWIDAIRALQADPDLRNRLAEQAQRDAAQYTWRQRARRIMEGLDSVARTRRGSQHVEP